MNFGTHEYQHRFYNQVPRKRPALYTPSDNSVLPLISQLEKYPTESYDTLGTPPPSLNKRAYIYVQEQPTYSPQRIKTEPTSHIEQQYKNNSMVIDRFRRQAEQYKHNVRFRHLRRDSQLNKYHSIQKSPSIYEECQLEPKTLIYNPEVLVPVLPRYDSRVMDSLNSYDQERKLMMSRLQRQSNESKFKLRDYKRKYSKLKDKLRRELQDKRRYEMRRAIQAEKAEVQKEKNRLSEIRKMMSSISDNLNKNSQLLNQSIRFQQEISLKNSSIIQKKSSLSNPKGYSRALLPTIEHTLTEYCDRQYSPPRSPPTVVYTKKSMDSQFGHMQKIQKDIENVNYRLKKLSQ